MGYMTVAVASKKWDISSRMVSLYCSKGRISNVIKKGNIWLIPENASKPIDMRKKSNCNLLPKLLEYDETMLSKIIEFFPYPIQVYSPNGVMILTNEACLQVMHIPSKDCLIGKFNVLEDPVIDKWGEEVKMQIAKSFQREVVHFQNLNMPIKEIINRFESEKLCLDSSYQNIICYPIYNEQNELAYVVHVFITSRLYDGKVEMIKAKEYIDNNWLEEFDIDKLAEFVNLSKYHFSRLFKKNTGVTPYGYYQDVKIQKIKEKLWDKNISVTQAFSICGVDYDGNYSRIFKRKTGMSPSKYRSLLN